MFEAMRKMIFPIIIVVLFFFVAMIVLQWGMQMSSRQDYTSANVAGVINGEEVPWQRYNRIYNNLVQAELAQTEEDVELPEPKIQELQDQAWNQLVADRLLSQEADRHQIVVTEEEIYGYLRQAPPAELQSMPYFQTEGKFDYQKYLQSMADPQMAAYWSQLEPVITADLRKLKVQQLVIQNAEVTETEVREQWQGATERVKVGMVNVGFDRFSRPPPRPTEEELVAYFEGHRDDYKLDERAGLNVVMLEKKPGRFDWEESHEQALLIYDSLQAGASFKELATDLSEDVGSARDSGNLGWFDQGRMVEEFDRMAFSMEDGELSEPIRTQFGWHIIKHFGYRDTTKAVGGEQQTVQQARCSHILVKAHASQETLDGLYEKLVEFEALAGDKGFFPAAEELSLPATPTGLFTREDNIPKIGHNTALTNFAFDGKVREISGVVESPNGFFVAEVALHEPAGLAEFEDVRDRVKMNMQKYLVEQLCSDTANAIWADIQSGKDIKSAAETYGEEYETPTEFGRGSYVKGIGRAPEAIGAAFSLMQQGEMTPPVVYDQGAVIFELLERTTADISEYTAKRDSVRNALMGSKQQELFSNWYQNLVESSEVVNNTQRLASAEAEGF